MERGDIYSLFNVDLGSRSSFNFTALNIHVKAFICPADLEKNIVTGNIIGNSQTSYAMNLGSIPCRQWVSGSADPVWPIPNYITCNGPFQYNAKKLSSKIKDFKDGTAKTFVYGETSRFLGQEDHFAPNLPQANWFGVTAPPSNPFFNHIFTSIAYSVPRINSPPLRTSSQHPHYATWIQTPTRDYLGREAGEFGNYGFRSLHPGGAHFLFMDGSVRFLQSEMDRLVQVALSTPNLGDDAGRSE